MSRPNILQVALPDDELRQLKRRAQKLGVPAATYAYSLLKAALANFRDDDAREAFDAERKKR